MNQLFWELRSPPRELVGHLVRKGGLEPPCLSAPPPQDGVSANFTTTALWYFCPLESITKPARKLTCASTPWDQKYSLKSAKVFSSKSLQFQEPLPFRRGTQASRAPEPRFRDDEYRPRAAARNRALKIDIIFSERVVRIDQ